jgi:putative transposase
MVTPAVRREAVQLVRSELGLTERRACALVGVARTTVRRQLAVRCDAAFRERLRTLAAERRRFGYRRLHVLIRREGTIVNHKRLYRIYREEGLTVRRRRRKKLRAEGRGLPEPAIRLNQRWSLDFMSDALDDGRRFRSLDVVDDCSRECLAMEIDTSLPGDRVVRVLDRLVYMRGKPDELLMDNGPEFTSRVVDDWAYANGVRLRFIDPGKPVQNAYVESFNGKARDEFFNDQWFESIQEARSKAEAWRRDYNEVRPHSSLEDVPPAEFARRLTGAPPSDGSYPEVLSMPRDSHNPR